MTVETYPSRETTSQRELRQAVGRQLSRTILFCALSLVAGIAIGHFHLQKQLEVQQGLVGQLQREIRGLTGDIQRLELESSRNIGRFEETIDRLEHSRLQELSGAFRGAQDRLDSLQRMVERQVQSTVHAEQACLAEFEAYRRKHLAVPFEYIAAAVERLTAKRSDELTALLEEVQAQSNSERSRLAALEGGWLIGSQRSEHPHTSQPSLQSPVPALMPTARIRQPATVNGTASQAAEIPSRLDSVALTPSELASTDLPVTAEQSIPAAPAEPEFTITSGAAVTSIEPIPDTTLPAPRPVIGPSGRRRAYGQLISFGSGRRVDMTPPQQSPNHATPVSTASAPTNEESR